MKLSLLTSLFLLFVTFARASAPTDRVLPLTSDETLSRVNRSPGILAPPSEGPTGDQAYLYYGLSKELPTEVEASSH